MSTLFRKVPPSCPPLSFPVHNKIRVNTTNSSQNQAVLISRVTITRRIQLLLLCLFITLICVIRSKVLDQHPVSMLILLLCWCYSLIHPSSGGLFASDCAAKGCKWKPDTFNFYDYSTTDSLLYSTMLSSAYITRALLYQSPLFAWQYGWMDPSSFHAYVVFETVDVTMEGNMTVISNKRWWSVEKNTELICMQRSKDWTDVVFYLKGVPRFAEYWANKYLYDFVAGDSERTSRWPYFTEKLSRDYQSRLLVFNNDIEEPALKVMDIIQEEQSVTYTLLYHNCKRFARKLFNGLSKPKTWDYFKP